MNTYWDSSALLDAILEIGNARQTFDKSGSKFTRCHALAETFSHQTGGKLGWRMLAEDTAKIIAEFTKHMTIVSLDSKQTLDALLQTRSRGVRGGGIHDFLHAYAAELNGCERIITGNIPDFEHVTDLEVVPP